MARAALVERKCAPPGVLAAAVANRLPGL